MTRSPVRPLTGLRRLRGHHVVAGLVALAFLAGVLGFAPYVRSRARQAAARYGAEVEIAWVVPVWGGVSLRGVEVRYAEAPGVRVELETVRVGWGTPRRVEVRGGQITLTGSFDDLAAQAERVRARLPKGDGSGDGSGTEIAIEGLGLSHSWEGVAVEGSGLAVAKIGGGYRVQAASAKWTSQRAGAEAAGASIELARGDEGLRIARLGTESLSLKVALGDLGGPDSGSPASEPAAGRAHKLSSLRSALARAETEASRALTADAKIDLEGVRAEIERGGERLSIGPATLQVRRENARTAIAYLAGALDTSQGEGLAIRTKLPIPGEPLAVEVRGGPIDLGTLGLRAGDLHLVDPENASLRMNARVEVDEHGEVGSFDGEASVTDLAFQIDEVAKDPVRGLKASFRGKVRGALDGSNISVHGGEIEVGSVRLVTTFDVVREPPSPPKVKLPAAKEDTRPRYKIAGSFEVPLVPCQALLDAAPSGLLPRVEGMRLAGSFSLKGKAKVDTDTLDRDFSLDYDVASSCRVTDVPPDVDVERFKKPFKLQVYAPHGEKELELETGPGSANWASYSAISRFMEPAVMTCEDGRFHRHEGFDHEAIRNSVRENIRQRKFVRGASTISMQLAKNLYLARDKRLGRKIEEAFLTMYLEQALTKEQILELYLNVVEFGPKIYGIEAGASHYFRSAPSRLTLSQAFYMASILPSPRVEHFGAGGALSPGWLRNLRTLMKHANKVKRVSDEDLEAGLAEVPLRGSPAPMRDPEAGPATPDKDDTVTEIEPQ